VTRIIRGRIWIIAMRDIAAGDEITYDYNFDWDLCRDHRCLCGAARCPGFIVRTDLRWRLRRRLIREKSAA
jgi:SET domain-containing protein